MRQAFIVIGLSYGDEGKGGVVDLLTRETGSKLTVRFSGGPQCSHTVCLPSGEFHQFHQFGSGTFAGAETYLGRHMLIEPEELMKEALQLRPFVYGNPLDKIYIEESCLVITPFHWIMNQLREAARGDERHGSCGHGLGDARSDELANVTMLRAGDLSNKTLTQDKLETIKWRKIKDIGNLSPQRLIEQRVDRLAELYKYFADRVRIVPDGTLHSLMDSPVIFEGNQGVLIDETWGKEPHRTWTDCTFRNALKMLDGVEASITRIGVFRTYFTRHGPGPFPTEDPAINWPDHNSFNEWQRDFRQGRFDMIAAKHALFCVGGVDGIALNHIDRTDDGFMPIGRDSGSIHYRDLPDILGTPILIEGRGPTAQDKKLFKIPI